ncbi:LysE family translocator [Vibrio sp. SS-MA-C1-2]|uniref:LysE family translocator n=1 Tax=Vibrio sp. SS-MA-C1-2 TaxID=2908646 RepID=UPI001F385357|nr:LysE family translocator [Vibrio sp. SS-MA-C1-2]UJF18054.1 LysE family translocator [Vibrio sp. SS-MA-C1-2]
MIDLAILPVYFTAIIALLLIPGPDMLLIASSSLSYGKKVGLFATLGNCTSGLILTLLAALGVSTLISIYPVSLQFLRIAGALYLLKMGWDSFTADNSQAPEIKENNNLAKLLYRRAVFSNLLNPKALIFFILFLPQFVSNHIAASSGIQMLTLGLILNVMGLLFNLILVLLVGSLGKVLLTNPKVQHYQHKVMGLVFFALAIWLIFTQLPTVHAI